MSPFDFSLASTVAVLCAAPPPSLRNSNPIVTPPRSNKPSQVAHAEKYARSYAPGESSNSMYGDGCGDAAILESPKHPKTDFTRAFNDKGHLVSPSIEGMPR